jgi:hypothetical protein
MAKSYVEVAVFNKADEKTDNIMKLRIMDRALFSFEERADYKVNYDDGGPFLFAERDFLEKNNEYYILLIDAEYKAYKEMYVGTFAEFCEYIQGYADALNYVREQHG